MQGRKDRICILFWDTHDYLPFVCHFERVDTEHPCRTSHALSNGDKLLADPDLHAALLGHLVDGAREASPGRVLHRMDGPGIEHLLHHAPERRHIRVDLLAQVESLAVGHDCDPVVAERSRDDDHVARFEAIVPHDLLCNTDPCGIDRYPVKGSLLDNFGVPRDHAGPGLAKGLIHRADNLFEVGHIEPLFDDHATGERDWLSTHHGEVVHRSAHRNPPNVPAGEEDRADHVGVCGKDDICPVDRDHGTVVERFKADTSGVIMGKLRERL